MDEELEPGPRIDGAGIDNLSIGPQPVATASVAAAAPDMSDRARMRATSTNARVALLAIRDGKDSDKRGRTAQIADYFLTGTLPRAFERRQHTQRWLAGGGDERLLCHLVCSRDKPDGTPAAPLQEGQAIWRTSNTTGTPDGPMPAAFRKRFANADELNLDSAQIPGRNRGGLPGYRAGVGHGVAQPRRRVVRRVRLAGDALPEARAAGGAHHLHHRGADGHRLHGVRQPSPAGQHAVRVPAAVRDRRGHEFHYRFTGRVFADARKALDRTNDVEEQRGVLRALGEAAMAEHVEWAVLHRERPLEAGRM